jgi:phosphoribosylformylglycinamidine cyclo-ligase
VAGIANGCRENGCVLLGGETAEMPGFYADGEYDVAGFIVGVVDREKIIDGKTIAPDDILLALPSLGLHTNGYSLARKLFLEDAGYQADSRLDELGATVGEALLQRHESYLRLLSGLLDTGTIKGLAHITGGGLLENIPRILPEGTGVEIQRGSWPVLPIFKLMQRMGNIQDAEMFRAFNMGVGMVIVCAPAHAPTIKSHVESLEGSCYQIGRVTGGDRRVNLAR